jgi:hypothetical protein
MLMSSLPQLEIRAEQVLPGSILDGEGSRGMRGEITQTMYAHMNK